MMVAEETTFLTDFDLHLFREGTHFQLYRKLGAQCTTQAGVAGTHFAVWAPNARSVSVRGDFNGWNAEAHPLSRLGESGVWTGFVPEVASGAAYCYHLVSWHQGYAVEKLDPLGFRQQSSPDPRSFVWDLEYEWGDEEWMSGRGRHNHLQAPWAIYEVDLESWRRVPEEGNRPLTYRELAPQLADYVEQMGFTHVEFLPVMEHLPKDRYQLTGYFAAASRFGAPQDLMYLIDFLHQRHIGVILDWVPAHFPPVPAGLAYFDGTQLYERGFCELALPEDGAQCGFDYERGEVRSFLMSSAFFWLATYHADGLRLDALTAMLYLDYGRQPEQWVPNRHGGRENLEGIEFLRFFNAEVYRYFPDIQTFGEEASGWPRVSRPTGAGGLGFGFKWDQGSVYVTRQYLAHDPFFRKFHHNIINFRPSYAFTENFVLPLSHEVARGEGSLLAQMPGDDWQKFANLRLLLAYVYLQPGKKLLFMGTEFAPWHEWNPNASLDWHLCLEPAHAGVRHWVGDLNRVYRGERALHDGDLVPAGFEWIEAGDAEQSTLSWVRRDRQRREALVVVFNFTPVVRRNFRVGVRRSGLWREILNSDAREYGGSGQGNFGGVFSSPFSSHQLPHTLTITLPPLAAVLFKFEGADL